LLASFRSKISNIRYPQPGEPVRDGTEVARFNGDLEMNFVQQPDGRFGVQNSCMHIEAVFKGGILLENATPRTRLLPYSG
jgi:hypothetical protein